MSLLKSFTSLPKSLRRLGQRRPTPSSRRRPRLELEALENRLVPSTIHWQNRGSPTSDDDGFNAAFGASAQTARADVDAALRSWANTIQDFNNGSNFFRLTVKMDTSLGDGFGRTSPNEM